MSLAPSLQQYLNQHRVNFKIIEHPRACTARAAACMASVEPRRLAKCVLLSDGDRYLVAVLPADRKVAIKQLSEHLQHAYRMATEDEVAYLFYDCEPGAIPPFGQAYGLPTVVDPSLLEEPDVYFESGDHSSLVQVAGDQFAHLLGPVPRAEISINRY
ncbi:Ala-tRNA(Pro) deacylase [Chitinivorax tropicus]|uniref:Ala-tRNA(Pro) deacylase n=1 Tax=Chitinivorax tropicus TaxID=714531 RepID=A0A840MQW8_9PROT|nr:YbaK/EbsC family protein [Chitinivorax tropicus]MBB5019172.1 Ala-tRNA(Pro) deacylase [Chitinivorax tropicus]